MLVWQFLESKEESSAQKGGNEMSRVAAARAPSAQEGSAQRTTNLALVGFVLLHIPVGVLLKTVPGLSTLHALLAFGIGLAAVALRPDDEHLPLYAAGYIAGAEVMWRITDAAVFHEFGKYAAVVIFGVGVLRRYRDRPLPVAPLLYVIYLLPAITFWMGWGFRRARREISFNLSGPLSLVICYLYLVRRRLEPAGLKRLTISVAASAVATVAVGAYNLLTASAEVRFAMGSSELAAGGAGPNQVSNLLALAVVLCWLLLTTVDEPTGFRLFLGLTLVGLLSHAILTFSRGGVFTAGLAIVATLPFLAVEPRTRVALFLLGALVLGVFTFVAWPWINAFTGGMAARRFTDPDTVYRMETALTHLRIWLDHPLFGVGPGFAEPLVDDYGLVPFTPAAHTEYTRLVAEHGLFGLASLVLLLWLALRSFLDAGGPAARAWAVGLLCYALGYMGQSAMRTLGPGFAYGLAAVSFFAGKSEAEE
jgi:O-antigen ligase